MQGSEAVAFRPGVMLLFVTLALLMAAVVVLSLGAGAVDISPRRVLAIFAAGLGLTDQTATPREALVLFDIRAPRTLLGLLAGAALAVSGALMQGLFRNPLADPSLVGVSSGSALAAAASIVVGDRLIAAFWPAGTTLPFAVLPAAAFLGGLITTTVLYVIATRQGRTSVTTMLLAGVALAALAGALTGLLVYVADDRQLRDLTFWSLGSLGGATWTKVAAVAPAVLLVIVAAPVLARGLNALLLGEAEAYHVGVAVQRLKRLAILLTALAVGVAVAACGAIGFVGIVVPHVIRLACGPDHRVLLPASALLGGSLLVGADVLARLLVSPSELPIGILTAAVGAPFFLWLLLRGGRGTFA
ncbi:FecCD family ABC transporter permease [Camelimonas lactis]|uniref:Iron complex transport system permease protein n=1 Tax=Camelimonas lactis TaxID=659006 RepID=A0A4R2GP65_9HYPH|nr:iron ABC transporter permease [Camelimonas lactis]TCO11194.1 iron complex transport system permease protein [Camelimonas lactis]